MTSSVSYHFDGLTAVVTGAGGALGGEAARQLAAAGAKVLAVDYAPEPLHALVAAITADGGVAVPYVADVRDPEAVAGYARAAAELGGGAIDLFFNNAGIEGHVARIADLDVLDFRRVFDVNVVGVLQGLKEVLPLLRAGGAVVNTGSTAALAGAAGMGSYIASKHAVLGLTRTAALEAAERGARVNAICPGPIEGRMIASLDQQRRELLGDSFAPSEDRTFATPASVAGVVLFLLSDAAALINGQAVLVTA